MKPVTPTYDWQCLACGHANGAGTPECAHCNCPAQASLRLVSAVREARLGIKEDSAKPVTPAPAATPEEINPVVLVLCVIGMLLGMAFSIFHVGPSGQHISVSGFIALWFRELIALVFVLGAILAGAAIKLQEISSSREPARPPTQAESNGRAWE